MRLEEVPVTEGYMQEIFLSAKNGKNLLMVPPEVL